MSAVLGAAGREEAGAGVPNRSSTDPTEDPIELACECDGALCCWGAGGGVGVGAVEVAGACEGK